MNVFDNIISFFNPAAGLKRAQQRAAIDVLRGYDGARKDRRSSGWKSDYDPNGTKLIAEQPILRSRSKSLYKNNSHSYRAHNSITNNSVGIGVLPAIHDAKIKAAWDDWANSLSCDFDEQYNFYGLQSLSLKTMSIQGECLILRIKTKFKKGIIPLEIKIISGEMLDSNQTQPKTKNGYVKGGIEYNAEGKRMGYWIFKNSNPDSFKLESVFWDKKDVIHLYQVEEPGQVRGIPSGTSSMPSLQDYKEYVDAQLTKQKISACFAGFVTNTTGDPDIQEEKGEDGQILTTLRPGAIRYLSPGEEMNFANPPTAEGYGDYSRNVLSSISAGYNVPYENMTNDLSNVNFSSGRMGQMEFGRTMEVLQWLTFIPKVCEGVWKWFIDAAIIAGSIKQESVPKTIQWTAPRRQMIDPVKEVNGLLAQVRAGFISYQEAVRSLGYTPEENMEEMIKAKQMFDAAGLQPESDPRYDVKTPYGEVKDEEGKPKK